MPDVPRPATPEPPPAVDGPGAGPGDGVRRIAGGFTVPEYEQRVWDMAKHQLHPAGLYVLAAVAGLGRLLAHPALDAPGAPVAEIAWFLGVFLGAWACFYSTMLRVAGLPSLTVTLLVPFTAAAALVTWFALPAPEEMDAATLWGASAALAGPGPVAFLLTLRRWRAHRRAYLHLLPEADR
jgi:hypothetical protein